MTTLEQHRAWKKRNPEKVRAYQLKHNPRAAAKAYGLDVDTVASLFAAQGGILCGSCNRCEGWVQRNGEKLRIYLNNPPARELLGLA